ncbi:hypothetical protein AOLI_G00209230 [Acnodon oligacanthus]
MGIQWNVGECITSPRAPPQPCWHSAAHNKSQLWHGERDNQAHPHCAETQHSTAAACLYTTSKQAAPRYTAVINRVILDLCVENYTH